MSRVRCAAGVLLGWLSSLAVLAGEAKEPAKSAPLGSEVERIERCMALRAQNDSAGILRELQANLAVRPKNDLTVYDMACTYSLMGDKKQALAFLTKAVEMGYDDFIGIEKDSDLDAIRGEAEYKALIKKGPVQWPVEKQAERVAVQLRYWVSSFQPEAYKYKLDADSKLLYMCAGTDAEMETLRKKVADYAQFQWKHLFRNKPKRLLAIAFMTDADLNSPVWQRHGGAYIDGLNALICADDPGRKAEGNDLIIHEFTHALMANDAWGRGQNPPATWLKEGVACLYGATEKKGGEYVPVHNPQRADVQAAIRSGSDVPWVQFMGMKAEEFLGRELELYPQARYMIFYMNEQGLLSRFLDECYENVSTKKESSEEAVEVVFGKPIEVVEREWRRWVLGQPFEGKPLAGLVPGYLGLAVEAKDGAVRIREVEKGSPAEKAGLRAGATVVEYGGKKVDTLLEFFRAFRADNKPGQKVTIQIQDGRKAASVTAELTGISHR